MSGKSAFNRILVGLDFSLMDRYLISYVAYLSYFIEPESIYFVNIQPKFELSKELLEDFPELDLPPDETLKHKLAERINKYFPEKDKYDVHVEVLEGSPTATLLHWTEVKKVDLLVVGRKQSRDGSGVVPQQLARKGHFALLYVPEKPAFRLNKVIVANDFSPHATAALETALWLKEKNTDMEIISEHVYHVPLGYYKTGKTEDQFAEIMEQHARRQFKAAARKWRRKDAIQEHYSFDRDKHSPAVTLCKFAREAHADMIMIGSHGRNRLSALILGSVAEKLIKSDIRLPLLVLRPTVESGSLWRSLVLQES